MITKPQKVNVICLSNQIWTYPLWTNKKHVMSRLSKMGDNVLFVDPPITTGRLFFRQLLKRQWSIMRLLTRVMHEGNLHVYSPLDYLPSRAKLAKKHALYINNLASKYFDKNAKTILWVYHVEIEGLENYLQYVKHDFLVYDCVDNYAGFPKYNSPDKKEKIIRTEKMLATRANIVFTTAPGLWDRLKKYNANTFYTPNVGDFEKFKDTLKIKKLPKDLEKIPSPRIGFTGAIDEYKFDRELFKKIANDYPGYSFVIIGPMALKDREANLKQLGLAGISNIHFLGSKDFSVLQNYLAGFDVMIIPYQLNDYTVGGCFPVKFHEELAAGLPIVVTDLPAYTPFNDVCYISKSYNEFSHNIRNAIEENSPEKVKARQVVASKNDWNTKVNNMLNLIFEKLSA
jgi:glycosyltransferase involved in cell wall biosynthesis